MAHSDSTFRVSTAPSEFTDSGIVVSAQLCNSLVIHTTTSSLSYYEKSPMQTINRESIELAMDATNVSTLFSSQYSLEKDAIRVPIKSIDKSKILYIQYTRPKLRRDHTGGSCF